VKSSRVRGKKKSGWKKEDWIAFLLILAVLIIIVWVTEKIGRNESNDARAAASSLCRLTMSDVRRVNGTLGVLGVRDGWWESDAIVKKDDMVIVVCKQVDVRTLGTVS